jgi:hypothetical protein
VLEHSTDEQEDKSTCGEKHRVLGKLLGENDWLIQVFVDLCERFCIGWKKILPVCNLRDLFQRFLINTSASQLAYFAYCRNCGICRKSLSRHAPDADRNGKRG